MIAYHLNYWSQNFDPIVWMRVVRVIFFFAAGVLMFLEPMQCGGRNRGFHRLLGSGFFILTWYMATLARNRMVLLMTDSTEGVSGLSTLLAETALTMFAIAMCVKLSYDYFEWRETHRLDRSIPVCINKTCEGGMS